MHFGITGLACMGLCAVLAASLFERHTRSIVLNVALRAKRVGNLLMNLKPGSKLPLTSLSLPIVDSDLQSVDASPRLNSLVSIAAAATIGGAFASGFLVYRNFAATNRLVEARRSVVLFVVIGLIALFAAWHLPSDFLSFTLWIGIPQISVVVLAAWNLQASLLAAHRSTGGEFRSLWFALLIGAIANAAIKAMFYGISVAIAG